MNKQSVWEQLTKLPFLGTYKNLITSAIRMDVFSQLTEPATAKAAGFTSAEKMTELFCSGVRDIDIFRRER